MKKMTLRIMRKNVVIEFCGREVTYPKHKGFMQIAELLAGADKEISCLLLAADNVLNVWEAQRRMEKSRIYYEPDDIPPDTYHSFTEFEQMEVMDQKYYNDLKKETNRLIGQIAVAGEYNDIGKKEDLQNELAGIEKHLKRMTLPGGKSANLPDEFSKPLDAVRKSVTKAIMLIGRNDLQLLEHLRKQIRIGKYCCYHSLPSVEVNVITNGQLTKATLDRDDSMP